MPAITGVGVAAGEGAPLGAAVDAAVADGAPAPDEQAAVPRATRRAAEAIRARFDMGPVTPRTSVRFPFRAEPGPKPWEGP
jgi:hypothetical protein